MLGADKSYDTRDVVADLSFSGFTPHVAQTIAARCRGAIHGRAVCHVRHDRLINAMRPLKARGRSRESEVYQLPVVAYNLIRLANRGLGFPPKVDQVC